VEAAQRGAAQPGGDDRQADPAPRQLGDGRLGAGEGVEGGVEELVLVHAVAVQHRPVLLVGAGEAGDLVLERAPEAAQPLLVRRAVAEVGVHRVPPAAHDQLGAVGQGAVEVVEDGADRCGHWTSG
jgi:hypothetical protein